MLIDSHAHIQGKEYAGDAEAVIARAHAAGVEAIVVVGGAGDMSSNSEAVRLANSFANVYATVGMHPHDAKDVGADDLAVLKQLAEDSRVVAIGETGLDYYYSHSPHDVQRRVFANSSRWRARRSCRSSCMNGTRRRMPSNYCAAKAAESCAA